MSISTERLRLATRRMPGAAALSWLRAHRFVLARTLWVALVALAWFVYATSLPAYHASLEAVCIGEGCVPGQLVAADARRLSGLGISLQAYSTGVLVCNVAGALVWFAVGIIIFLRKPRDWMALLVALSLMLVGASVPTSQNALAWRWPTLVENYASFVTLFLVFCLFPSGKFVPASLRWLPPVFLVLSVADFFPALSLLIPDWLEPVHVLLLFACLGILGAAQVYRYRAVSTPAERQQTKWVLVGSMAAIAGEFIYWAVSGPITGMGRPGSLYELLFSPISIVLILFIPLSIGMAILRYRLYDIHMLVNRALVYGTLTVSLIVVYASSVLVLQSVFRAVTQQTSNLAIVVSTLFIAALFQPLRKRVQRTIDQHFYRRRYNAARTLEQFNATLRTEVDLPQLAEQLVDVVQKTMAPERVSLWLIHTHPNDTPEASGSHFQSPEV